MQRFVLTFFVVFIAVISYGQDTIESPKGSKFLAYKYLNITPMNVREAITALTLYNEEKLTVFKTKELDQAVQSGLEKNYRLNIDWGFETGSQLTSYFWAHRIYTPNTMKSIILMALHKALNGNEVKEKKIIRKCKWRHRKEEKEYKKKFKAGTIYYNTPPQATREQKEKPKTYTIDLENGDPEKYPEQFFYKH